MTSVYPASADGPPRLALLMFVFVRDANLTFGGGAATAETLRREVVARRRWLSEPDFRLAYAASRFTPATNLLALCTAIGWRVGGLVGAAAALLASSVPCAVIAGVVMAGYQEAVQHRGPDQAVRGAVAVSVALLVSSVWALAKPHAEAGKRVRGLFIMGAAWATYALTGASALAVLMTAATLGAIWTREG